MLVWRSAGIKAVPSHGRRQPGLSRKRGLPSESGSAVGANSHPWVTLTRWRCSRATTSSELACTMPPNGPDPRGLSSEPRVPGWRSSAGWAYKPLAAEPLCAFSGRSPNGSSHWVLRSFVGRLEPITGYRSSCGTPTSHPSGPSPLLRPSVVTTMRANPVTTSRSFTGIGVIAAVAERANRM